MSQFLNRYCEAQRAVAGGCVFRRLEPDAVIRIRHKHRDIPQEFRRCTYCGGRISIHFESWTRNEDGTWSADFAKAECESEPSMMTYKWDEWMKQHTYMPYVYWLPLETVLTRWVNKHFRFNLENEFRNESLA